MELGNTKVRHRDARGVRVIPGPGNAKVRVCIGPNAGNRSIRVPIIIDGSSFGSLICGSFCVNSGYSIGVITNYNVRGSNRRLSRRSNVRAFRINGGTEIHCIRGRCNRNDNAKREILGPIAIIRLRGNDCLRVRAIRVRNISSAGEIAGTSLGSSTHLIVGRGVVADNDRCTRARFAISVGNGGYDTSVDDHSITGNSSGRGFVSIVGNGGRYTNRSRYSTVVVRGTYIGTIPRVATGSIGTSLVRRTTVNGVTNRRVAGLVALNLSRGRTRRRVIGNFLGWERWGTRCQHGDGRGTRGGASSRGRRSLGGQYFVLLLLGFVQGGCSSPPSDFTLQTTSYSTEQSTQVSTDSTVV